MKSLHATFDDRQTAWTAITEITRKNIIGRHEIKMEAVDPNNPNGKTRVVITPKLAHERKDSFEILKKYGASITDDKGKEIKGIRLRQSLV